jgi:hypothetical protein
LPAFAPGAAAFDAVHASVVHIAGVTVAPAMECLHVPQELLNAAFPAPLFLPAFDRQDAP